MSDNLPLGHQIPYVGVTDQGALASGVGHAFANALEMLVGPNDYRSRLALYQRAKEFGGYHPYPIPGDTWE